MKKRNFVFALLLLLVVATASVVSGTYARYTATDTGTGKATVAKWSVVVTEWQGASATKVVVLEPDTTANPYVASGLIAPEVEVTGWLTVDLTGTQVATDLSASIENITITNAPTGLDTNALTSHFAPTLSIYAANGTTLLKTVDLTTGEKYLIELSDNKLKNEVVKIKVGFKWITQNNDADNAWDTLLGEYGNGSAPVISATLNIDAQQHVLSDNGSGSPIA